MKKSNEEYLKKYEQDLITALFYSYSRPIPTSALMEIESIITQENVNMPSINYSCSSCILKLLRMAAKVYFKEFPERVPEKLRNRKI